MPGLVTLKNNIISEKYGCTNDQDRGNDVEEEYIERHDKHRISLDIFIDDRTNTDIEEAVK